jgi:hypothetical protein
MQPLVTTLVFDVVVLILVVVLFKYLHSQATAEGTGPGIGKWKAGGALAGFLILMVGQLYLIGYFTPKGEEALPSYHTIMKFYDSLEQGKYAEAWNLMSPDLQKDPERWRGKKDLFEAGYRNTRYIRLRAIKLVSASSSQYSHDYVAYYQDETKSPVLSGLANLDEQTVRDIPALNDNIMALRKVLLEKGVDITALDDMTLDQLLSANRGDVLRFRIEKIPGAKKADDLFPKSKIVHRLVGKTITVGLHDKKWLIDKIEPILDNVEGKE